MIALMSDVFEGVNGPVPIWNTNKRNLCFVRHEVQLPIIWTRYVEIKKSLSGRELILKNILNDNTPLYSCLPGDLAFEWQRGWRQPRCYSKARALSEQLWNGLLCSRNFPEAWGLILHRETMNLKIEIHTRFLWGDGWFGLRLNQN